MTGHDKTIPPDKIIQAHIFLALEHHVSLFSRSGFCEFLIISVFSFK